MSIGEVVFTSIVIIVFGTFALGLGWADYQTGKIGK
jgi:hypothetical protein